MPRRNSNNRRRPNRRRISWWRHFAVRDLHRRHRAALLDHRRTMATDGRPA